MGNIKRRMELFQFYDYTGIERHLERMALKGWQLCKMNSYYWVYRKAPPQKLTYTVTYFHDASSFDHSPTEDQETFYEYCRLAGWQLAAQWAQMQVFCTDRENPVPIETDERVKLKAVDRAVGKLFLPSHMLLLLLAAFMLIMQWGPFGVFSYQAFFDRLSNGLYFASAASSLLLAVYALSILINYALWHKKSMKAVELGLSGIPSSAAGRLLARILLVLSLLLLGYIVYKVSLQLVGPILALTLLQHVLLVAGILGARALFKRMKLSRQSNILLTALVCVALAVGFTVLRFRLIASEAEQGRLGGRSPAAVYTVEASDGGTWTWKAYNDPLPLRLEDLQAVPDARYSYEWTVQESVLMGYYTARQFSHPEDRNAPDLRYEVVDVKLHWLYEPSLNQYFRRYSISGDYPTEFQRQLRRTDDPAWQADAVYQLFRQDIALSEYLICWGSRLVYIQFDEIPAAEQIAVAAEKLRAA